MNSFKKTFYIFLIFIFSTFAFNKYSSFKKNKTQNSMDKIFFKNLEEKFSKLPYLSNDTKDIIDFDNTVNNIDNKKKKRKFWELLK